MNFLSSKSIFQVSLFNYIKETYSAINKVQILEVE